MASLVGNFIPRLMITALQGSEPREIHPMIETTLQINLAPGDYRLAKYLLPQQIAAWRGQVDEVLLVLDLHRSAGRFAEGWEDGRDRMLALIDSLDGVRCEEVDYGTEAARKVAEEWTSGQPIPRKDFRGGPSYSYFFGLSAARGRYVLHTDSDMFFGGLSPTWFDEAKAVYESFPDILFLGPLSGPPHPEGRIETLRCEPDTRVPWGKHFNFMSTRLFLIDRIRFRDRIGAFRPQRPNLRSRIKAKVEGNPEWDLPEHWMTAAMTRAGMCRFEFLGTGEGMWSLHPPYRCEAFFAKIPELIDRVESGDLPDAQRGYHDFNASMVDWAEAIARLKRNRWWRRFGPGPA